MLHRRVLPATTSGLELGPKRVYGRKQSSGATVAASLDPLSNEDPSPKLYGAAFNRCDLMLKYSYSKGPKHHGLAPSVSGCRPSKKESKSKYVACTYGLGQGYGTYHRGLRYQADVALQSPTPNSTTIRLSGVTR